MAVAAILNSKNFNFWSRDCSGSTFAVVYRISSKSDNFSLRYDDLTIFKMAVVRHLGFYTFAFFCPAALDSMLFCFIVQNFAEIGQLLDE